MDFVPAEAVGSRLHTLYQKLIIERVRFAVDTECLTLQSNF